jgi:hypothetical protein
MNTNDAKTSADITVPVARPESSPATELDLSHLDESAKKLLYEPLSRKLEAIFEDKFILHRQATNVLSTFKQALARPKCERPSCYLLVGGAGSGKTGLMHKLFSDLGGDVADRVGTAESMPILIVETPGRATEPRLVLAISRALKMPVITENQSRKVTDIILRKLSQKRVRMVVFLEFDHFAPVPEQEREVAFHFIKNITNEGISVVGVGTQKSCELVLKDEQLTSRLRPLYLQGFANDQEYVNFVGTLESFYPFPRAGFLWRDHIGEIYRRTHGVVGETVMLLNEAAAWALCNGRPSLDREAIDGCKFVEPLAPLRSTKK